jgi:hypothetical protein
MNVQLSSYTFGYLDVLIPQNKGDTYPSEQKQQTIPSAEKQHHNTTIPEHQDTRTPGNQDTR